jgi:hypothetical protein
MHSLALPNIFNRKLVGPWKRFRMRKKRPAPGLQTPSVEFSVSSAKLFKLLGQRLSNSVHLLLKMYLQLRNLPLCPSFIAAVLVTSTHIRDLLLQVISLLIIIIAGALLLLLLLRRQVAIMGGPVRLRPFGVFRAGARRLVHMIHLWLITIQAVQL